MRKRLLYCVRVIGTPQHRHYLVQRSDGRFLGAAGRWVDEQQLALVYRTVADAQTGCRPFVKRQTRGKPRRQFTCTLEVTVVGRGTDTITAADVAGYLRDVMLICVDYEIPHDGPLAGHHVEARALVGGLTEVLPAILPGRD